MRRRIAAALLAALLLTGCAPPAEPAAAEPAEPAGEPVYMALTFDDGPSPAWTPRLLEEVLKETPTTTQTTARSPLSRRRRKDGSPDPSPVTPLAVVTSTTHSTPCCARLSTGTPGRSSIVV